MLSRSTIRTGLIAIAAVVLARAATMKVPQLARFKGTV